MRKEGFVFYQECITKKRVAEPSFDIDSFDSERSFLQKLDEVEGNPHVIFCSLQKANALLRHPFLTTGLFYPKHFLDYNVYSMQIPQHFLLNSDYILLPWGMIESKVDDILKLFGNNIFIRPNSSQKTFTGFCKKGKDELLFEIRALSSTVNVSPETICVIAQGKEIEPVEYRFWIVGDKISTWAPYSWGNEDACNHLPSVVYEKAQDFAMLISNTQEAIVADFCIWNGKAKLIECNAISTSGWYSGIEEEKLISDLISLGGF